MIDETVSGGAEQVGFCQDCGKPLTRETVRTVGSAAFCEPCLEARLGAAPSAGSVPPAPGSLPPIGGSDPSPVLAALLGLIPGVGAMYNGQFAKGIAHIVIFALLDSMAHVSSVFGLLVAGWVFYQSFEAYHTAQARREGSPLPDPFGLNNIGEQMGVHFRGTHTGTQPGAGSYGPPRQSVVTPVPEPPTPPPAEVQAWGSVPVQRPTSAYAETASQQPAWNVSPINPPRTTDWTNTAAYTADVPARSSRFPGAAMWLIGFGLLFLVLNLMPEWRFSIHKIVPFFLMVLAVVVFVRRMDYTGGINPATGEREAYVSRAACVLRGPVILFTIGVLLALQAFDIVRFGKTWPVLVIVIGLLMLVERSLGGRVVARAVNVDAGGAGKGI